MKQFTEAKDILLKQGFEDKNTLLCGPDCIMVEWFRKKGDTVFKSPTGKPHHSLAINLAGGGGTRRLSDSGVLKGWGAGQITTYHAEQSAEWWYEKEDASFVTFYFKPEYLEHMAGSNLDVNPSKIDFRSVFKAKKPFYHDIMRHLVLPYDWQAPENQLGLSHAVQLLTYRLMKDFVNFREPVLSSGSLPPITKKRLIEYLEVNYSKPITVEELAGVANLSSFHFLRLFKQTFNQTPHQYLLKLRIEKACGLLLATDADLSSVALATGFSSQAHFSHRFKLQKGVSPGRFRMDAVGRFIA
ncbi:helix-turn-helix domain-containing protein [Aestuariispira insulae]|uniref:AraC family transcriptional regulator n=1 Tax=Aestuariispira insulae TaxID=1461337 RepID=A0A3D9H2I1_9PROT|nr:AraC family transcriptional regulator [Aestuariispira insulae]RED43709.1 AraC family transcriptional regulator [Aestuariispira insulae]